MKKEKSKYYICIILAFVIIIALLVIKNLKKPEEVNIKASALRLEDVTNYDNELKVYLDTNVKEEEYSICYDERRYCGEEFLTIKTESDESYLLDNYKYKYFFYTDDDKIKVYNADEKQSYVIDKLTSDYTAEFIVNNNAVFTGVVFTKDLNEHVNYLLIDGNEILYKNKYDYISSLTSNYLAANRYDENGKQKGAYIVNATKEEKPLISREYKTDEYYGFFNLGKKYISFEYDKRLEIYDNETLKLIYKTNRANTIDGEGNPMFLYGVDSKDNIIVYDNLFLIMLDNKGKEVKKSKNAILGVGLVDKYVVSTTNNELGITDIDNNHYDIASLENGRLEYYDFTNKDGRAGIVFNVYDKTVTDTEVYNSCKNSSCKGMSFSEFKKEYGKYLGYEYFFDYANAKVTKTPSIIVPSTEEE